MSKHTEQAMKNMDAFFDRMRNAYAHHDYDEWAHLTKINECTQEKCRNLARDLHGGTTDDGVMIDKTSNELTVQHQNDVALCDTMLGETSSSTPKILCKKGQWSQGGEDIPSGKEFIAYPMDAMRGFCRWEDGRVVEQRIGRIADKFRLKREDLPADEDWKPQVAMALEDPETGEVFSFVSGSTGGKIAVEQLIHLTARAAKKGKGDLTPLVRLSTSTFPTTEFGMVIRPAFEIVPRVSLNDELNDEIPI